MLEHAIAWISIAWIYWDPAKDAFILPFFNLAIAWYGVFFAAGFVAAYFMLIPLFKRRLENSNTLYMRDISDWHALLAAHKILLTDKALRKEIENLSPHQEPSIALKQALLAALNHRGVNRKTLEKQFPQAIVKAHFLSTLFADRLTWLIVLGTIIGARLGHVFFYGWPYYKAHPGAIFMIREGGLASHGGTVGVMLALWLFIKLYRKQFPELTFFSLIDMLVIPTCVPIMCIRLGNFFNQEILGSQTNVPWAVLFVHPADQVSAVPRHPVQLYEAAAYFVTFIVLLALWKKKRTSLTTGVLSGVFFILVFGARFLLEFFKLPESMVVDESVFLMGQYLSLPFICLGVGLLISSRLRKLKTQLAPYQPS